MRYSTKTILAFFLLLTLAVCDTRLSSARHAKQSAAHEEEGHSVSSTCGGHCAPHDNSCCIMAGIQKHGATIFSIVLFITAYAILTRH